MDETISGTIGQLFSAIENALAPLDRWETWGKIGLVALGLIALRGVVWKLQLLQTAIPERWRKVARYLLLAAFLAFLVAYTVMGA